MADDATSVGGIKGTLDLDLSPWDRSIAQAKSDIAELKGLDADVKLTASITEAERQIAIVDAAADRLDAKSVTIKVKADASGTDAVTAAEAKVAAAIQVSDTATARAQISELRLAELREKGAISASQLAAAELALSVAIQKSDSAAAKAAAAEDALAAAQAATAQAAVDEAAGETVANEALEEHTERLLEAGEAQILMVAGIGALIVALPALSGAALGLGGGLTGMGVAGAAAIYGITQQVKQGTATGQEYSAGLASLKSELDKLGDTGANVMLSSFQAAEQEVTGDFPALNGMVAEFSGMLGRSADNLIGGTLTGLKVLNPLLEQGGRDLEGFTAGLEDAAGSSEFRQFIAYAEEELPHVEALIGSAVGAALHLLQSFAPIGDVVVDVLTHVTDAISAIPVPVLTAAAGAAATVGAAFLAWKAIYPIITSVQAGTDLLAHSQLGLVATTSPLLTAQAELAAATTAVSAAQDAGGVSAARMASLEAAQVAATEAVAAAEAEGTVATVAFGSALDFATGPIGIIIAVAGALGLTLLGTSQATRNATAATASYTDAIRDDSGALGENTRAQVAKSLSDAGAFRSASQLGITQQQLTDAVLGQGDALDVVNSKIKENGTQYGTMVGGAGQAGVATKGLSSDALKLKDVLGQQSGSVKESVQAYKDQQAALEDASAKTSSQALALGVSSAAYKTAADAASKQAAQTKAATLAMQLENDAAGLLTASLDLMNGKTLGQAEAQTAFAGANNSLTESLKTNGTAIEGNSAKAVANQQAVQQSVSAAQALAEATAKSTGSTAAGTKSLEDSKAQLEAQYPALKGYIDRILQIPKTAPTKAELDKSTADAALQSYNGALNSVPRTVATTASANTAAANAAIRTLINNIANIPGYKAVVIDQQIKQSGADRGAVGAAYNSHGGEIAQHFASGGTSGTVLGSVGSATSDSLLTHLSIGEEVTQASAASYPGVRPLLKAVNADPAGTMRSLSSQSGGGTVVSLAGAVITATIDGQPIQLMIQDQIVKSSQARKVSLSAGRQNGTF